MKNIYRHGELVLIESVIPKLAKITETLKEKVVAHSETGHNHILTAELPFNVYEYDGKTYISTMTTAKLWHKKTGNDVHRTLEIKPATYEIIQKREFNYFEKLIQKVRD